MNTNEVEINFQDYEIDLFICENGSLGITVYAKGQHREDDTASFVDIHIDEKAEKVTSM